MNVLPDDVGAILTGVGLAEATGTITPLHLHACFKLILSPRFIQLYLFGNPKMPIAVQ